MAVPWINFLAPSMGGIGPIELNDLERLNKLTDANGIPFYAGRFYPKDSQAIIDGLQLGLISQTPPWLTWEEIKPTQIWMIPVFEDERIVSTLTTIERIDWWPRLASDNLPEFEPNAFDARMIEEINIRYNDHLDPGILVRQNVLPPIFAAGYVGISEIKGQVTEWAFYDQELTWINKKEYGNPRPVLQNELTLKDDYSEIVKVRSDGVHIKSPADIPASGKLEFPLSPSTGRPLGFSRVQVGPYDEWANTDPGYAKTVGNNNWNDLTKMTTGGTPRVGSFAEIKTSALDTMVITIKTSCITVVIPDADPLPGSVAELGTLALETLGSNLTNNIWYFYLPVRFDARNPVKRIEFLLNRAGINKIDNPSYYAP